MQLQSAPATQVGVDYDVVAGTATPGADFVAGGGRVEFAPGERLRYIPVQVLDDSARETRETIVVQLRDAAASSGPVLGSPRVMKIGIAGNDRRGRRG